MAEKIRVRVDSFKPETREEVNRLLNAGWEIEDVETEDHKSCHDSSIASYETVYYILTKTA